MITKELEAVLYRAVSEAKRLRHEFVTLEHVLFAMTQDEPTKKLLAAVGVNSKVLQKDIEQYFAENVDALPEGEDQEPMQTPTFQRVLQRAYLHVQSSGKDTIDPGHVLVAMFREPHVQAVHLLEKQGVSRLDIMSYISHGAEKDGGDTAGAGGDEEPGFEIKDGVDEKKDPLSQFTVDLNERAKKGLIDPLVGRAYELERTVQILCRRRKNNPLYVGEAGVGKTAIAEGLALRIVEGKVPEPLKDARIFSLDLGGMLAGTKFRGDFEARVKGVLNQLEKTPGAILFIDEIHMIYGAGATSGSSADASNLLKPALASGKLRCIGSTTFAEYKSVFEKDHALNRRFQKIDVLEPSLSETIDILKGLRRYYEEHHAVRYTDEALVAAATLSQKHINDRLLPDKAIDVIDEAGAVVKLRPADSRERVVGEAEVEEMVAKMARIPPKSVSSSDKDKLASLESDLKKMIFGQDQAVDNLVSVIKLQRSGLGHPEKPIGSFLFSGPTGVGKTELARQLAKSLGVELIRFDMSEYMEKHTVSRLIGAPPGYVGFDQGGMLTDAVRKQPHAVLILDEIEKAHPDVFNILLQVMDHATLTDNNGRKADFRHVCLVMTTNAGAQELTRESLGFASAGKPEEKKDKNAVERTFSPEFRNRLDAWITFGPLQPASIAKVVDKFVKELENTLKEKNVALELNEDARLWLAEHGYEKLYGARPMGRLIQNELKKPLAEAILFGELVHGGACRVVVKDNKLALTYEASARPLVEKRELEPA